MNAAIKKRLDALTARMKPPIPLNEIAAHLVKQMQATLTGEVGYIETPVGLLPYAEHFFYSSLEGWRDLQKLQAEQSDQMFGKNTEEGAAAEG